MPAAYLTALSEVIPIAGTTPVELCTRVACPHQIVDNRSGAAARMRIRCLPLPFPPTSESVPLPISADHSSVPRGSQLTGRQLEILRNVARGRTNREIGVILGISERTVRNHMREILRRLSTRDRTHSVVVAIGSGWIAIPVEPDDSAAMPVGTPSTAEVPSGS